MCVSLPKVFLSASHYLFMSGFLGLLIVVTSFLAFGFYYFRDKLNPLSLISYLLSLISYLLSLISYGLSFSPVINLAYWLFPEGVGLLSLPLRRRTPRGQFINELISTKKGEEKRKERRTTINPLPPVGTSMDVSFFLLFLFCCGKSFL